ncbi:MAG: DUF7940 domain-containing protein [Rhizomicrobium sp.]
MRLIENWHKESRRLWSMRITIGQALFWSAACGLWILWPALAGAIPIPVYFGVGLLLAVSTGIARVLKQPGTDQ